MESACATVGISRATVSKWAARGRAGASAEAADFARRLDRLKGAGNNRVGDEDIAAVLEPARGAAA